MLDNMAYDLMESITVLSKGLGHLREHLDKQATTRAA